MSDRTLQKELRRPDEFVTIMGRLMQILVDRSRELAITFIGILILGAGVLGWHAWKERKDAQAADAFEKILEPYSYGSEPAWDKVSQPLEDFLKTRRRTSVARVARLYFGKALLASGKYTEAADIFRQAGNKLKVPYRYLAKEGEALALMELKRWEEAESILTDLSKAEDNPFRDEHMWNLGLAQEGAQRNSKAVATYQEFETKFPQSPLLEQVRARLTALRQAAPSL